MPIPQIPCKIRYSKTLMRNKSDTYFLINVFYIIKGKFAKNTISFNARSLFSQY